MYSSLYFKIVSRAFLGVVVDVTWKAISLMSSPKSIEVKLPSSVFKLINWRDINIHLENILRDILNIIYSVKIQMGIQLDFTF